ncbi:ferritin-like domain-containing protein [Solihabitans fulvus]|uniref:Ferritin-like domain-containing protein n=1 Tax=Solihabitans fulvus TaxID=1892852 RepID=A0A5B2XSE6_9PSEU|nr:ferritin-like domain-containing protein [Solihabitans fulvus]KAA2265791.1 ferritin-like domain-containing protein [Solihabitans fulvus]
MPQVTVRASVAATLSWQYAGREARLQSLYQRAKHAQWNAASDVDWSIEVPFGAPLPMDSGDALGTFAASPLAGRGPAMWDVFRWELQSWMVSQFLHGEQAALVVAGRLVESMPDVEGKLCAASQAIDEARHVEVFSRYAQEKLPRIYPICAPLATLVEDILGDARWDITALGMQILVEALAMAAFRLVDRTFHDDLIKDITRLVARDEARHVSFGVVSLGNLYRELTSVELADREELVLEAAVLTRRRFLLEDVWERLDVPAAAGAGFAASDPTMTRYRQTIFAKVFASLRAVGLLTERVRTELAALELVPRREGARW